MSYKHRNRTVHKSFGIVITDYEYKRKLIWLELINKWTQEHKYYLTGSQGLTMKFVSLQCLIYQWFDAIEIHNPTVAHLLCQMIPAHCPFEREIKLFNHTLLHIPPLCKLNPLYEQVVALRFKALSYLVDECREDIALYCQQ